MDSRESGGEGEGLDLPNPGVKPRSPALQMGSLPSEPPGKPPKVEMCYFPSSYRQTVIFELQEMSSHSAK